MRESRKVETPSPAQLKERADGATRSFIGELNGTMLGPGTCEFTAIETPETSVPGVFVCGGHYRSGNTRTEAVVQFPVMITPTRDREAQVYQPVLNDR